MSSGTVIDIDTILERRIFSGFLIRLIVVSWFATFLDGFDTGAISFVAPYLTKELHLDQIQLGNLFAIGIAGLAVGSTVFGFLGDRIGRRPAILWAVGCCGLLTLLTTVATNYAGLAALRFLAGVGLGGALPLIWSINLEFAPARVRSTVIAVIMVGYTLGSASSGPATIALAPTYGWRAVFAFGGMSTLIALAVLALALPESARFLFRRNPRHPCLHDLMRKVDPTLGAAVRPYACQTEVSFNSAKTGVRQLFAGSLLWITPVLWLGYIGSSALVFLTISWTPTILEMVSFTRTDAAWIASSAAMAACILTILLSGFVDRKGPFVVALMPILAMPIFATLAFTHLPQGTFLGFYVAMFLLIAGAHNGVNSIAARFYPTSSRALGTGWALAVSKVGGVLGPSVAGLLLRTRFSYHAVFVFDIVCGVVLALSLSVISLIHAKQGWEGRR